MKRKSTKASTEDKWAEVRVPKDMLNKLDEFLESKFAKRLGFTNKSMAVATAIRSLLNEGARFMSCLELIDVDSKRVLIMDHNLDETIEISIDDARCSKHEKNICDHVKFAWMIPVFANQDKNKKTLDSESCMQNRS